MQVVAERKKLVLHTSKSAEIVDAIPHARVFTHGGKLLTALEHGVEESLVLRNLGFKETPAPILSYYKWPGRFKAMEHQKQTAAFLTMNRKGLCLNAPGTAKTLSSLWAADFLLQEGLARKVLIIAPLSTLKVVWGKELRHHLCHRSFEILTGTRQRRIEKLKTPGVQFLIINHDGFNTIQDHLGDVDVVIYDEITALKSPSSQRFKRFYRWTLERDVWLWGLTGTPISQSPVDAWTLAKLVGSKHVPRSFTTFKDLVMNKVSTFRWVPRPEAMDICQKVLQPSIRYSLDECMELPDTVFLEHECPMSPEQIKAFKEMKERAVLLAHDVSAPNMAVVLQKLVQICCIEIDTPVLTATGWKPIQSVTAQDLLWDGEEWVTCSGSVCHGYKPVIRCGGVSMTPDHLVLAARGWTMAQEIDDGDASKGFNRAEVRLPDCAKSGRLNPWRGSVRDMALPLRLRAGGSSKEPVSTSAESAASEELRLPPWERNAQDGANQSLWGVGKYAQTLSGPLGQGLEKLRGARDNGLRFVGQFIRRVLGGYEARVFSVADVGTKGQRRPLLPSKLPMGDRSGTGEQSAGERADTNPRRRDDHSRSSERVWAKTYNNTQAFGTRKHGHTSASEVEVYDVLSCGPRNRFVVRGSHGELSIVHNCGVIYGNDGGRVKLDYSGRYDVLKEVIDEIGDKVIIFVPLRGVQDALLDKLTRDGYDVASVHGDVTGAARNKIFDDFQNSENVKVLLAHPKVAAHGLTLTRAKDIIWYAPIYSLESFEQANCRIRRLSTTGKTRIHLLWGTSFEKELYSRLQHKKRVLAEFLDLVRGVNE